jgi:hypothetical protein
MATTAWFVVFPANEHPGNAFPANAKVVSAQTGSAAYKAWLGNGAFTVTGTSWQVDAGPFSTQQQAQQWAPHALSVGDWVTAGIAGVMEGAGGATPTAAVGTGSAVADALGGFNISAWFLRIGEILLGIVLVGVGIARITGAQNAISNIVKTKMPLPIPV